MFSSLIIYTILYPFAVLRLLLHLLSICNFLGAGVEDFANGILRIL